MPCFCAPALSNRLIFHLPGSQSQCLNFYGLLSYYLLFRYEFFGVSRYLYFAVCHIATLADLSYGTLSGVAFVGNSSLLQLLALFDTFGVVHIAGANVVQSIDIDFVIPSHRL